MRPSRRAKRRQAAGYTQAQIAEYKDGTSLDPDSFLGRAFAAFQYMDEAHAGVLTAAQLSRIRKQRGGAGLLHVAAGFSDRGGQGRRRRLGRMAARH